MSLQLSKDHISFDETQYNRNIVNYLQGKVIKPNKVIALG